MKNKPFHPQIEKWWSSYSSSFQETSHEGISIRDWFAGQALIAIMKHYGAGTEAPEIAQEAYTLADAMLRERALPTPQPTKDAQ